MSGSPRTPNHPHPEALLPAPLFFLWHEEQQSWAAPAFCKSWWPQALRNWPPSPSVLGSVPAPPRGSAPLETGLIRAAGLIRATGLSPCSQDQAISSVLTQLQLFPLSCHQCPGGTAQPRCHPLSLPWAHSSGPGCIQQIPTPQKSARKRDRLISVPPTIYNLYVLVRRGV